MASSNSTCPKCGKPSEAKVSCHECRRTVRDSGCGECGKSLGARRGSVCAPCGYAKKPLMPCAGCGERKRIVARGRCGSCHSRAHRAERGRKLDRFEIICAGCHRPAIVGKSATRFCTHECWSRYENGRGKVVAVYRRPRVWLGGVVPSSGRGFTSGPCVYCGGTFTGRGGAVYCSDKCRGNAAWKRRFDRKGEFSVPARTRLSIYERDGWVCQLCDEPVDPGVPTQDRMGHTLDHVVPQSQQLIPDHSPSNLRLAHRICNSLRGDGTREVEYGSTSAALPELGGLQAASAQ